MIIPRRIHLSMFALLLVGCANPILDVRAPGYSNQTSAAPSAEPATMAQAMQKLNHVRAQYYEAIRKQTGDTQEATTGLVWLGTAIAGLAAGRVHSDAILYPALIGGTTYGLSRVQLDARRIKIWTEGLKALDCAKEATLPVMLPDDFLAELQMHAVILSQARHELQAATAQLRSTEVENSNQASEVANAAAAADNVLTASAKSLKSTFAVRRAAAGNELSATVDRIHTKVTEAMGDIAVDITAAKLLIAGLGGFAADFAPGSAIQQQVGDLFLPHEKGSKDKSQSSASDAAKRRFEAAIGAHGSALHAVNALLETVDIAPVSTALKQCNVAGISTTIVLSPASLQFTEATAASKLVSIGGGTPPYTVTIIDGTDALSKNFNGGLSDEFSVATTSKIAPGSFSIRVTDSGQFKRTVILPLSITAKTTAPKEKKSAPVKPTATPPAKVPDNKATTGTALQELQSALTLPPIEVKGFHGVDFVVAAAEVTATGLKIKLTCSKADAKLPLLEVRGRLLNANEKAKAAAAKLTSQAALDSTGSQLDLSPSGNCIKP
jgi:hypothetical protein